jgi:hypothetical protein
MEPPSQYGSYDFRLVANPWVEVKADCIGQTQKLNLAKPSKTGQAKPDRQLEKPSRRSVDLRPIPGQPFLPTTRYG